MTHGFLADLTSSIEVDELPTVLASRSVIKGMLLGCDKKVCCCVVLCCVVMCDEIACCVMR